VPGLETPSPDKHSLLDVKRSPAPILHPHRQPPGKQRFPTTHRAPCPGGKLQEIQGSASSIPCEEGSQARGGASPGSPAYRGRSARRGAAGSRGAQHERAPTWLVNEIQQVYRLRGVGIDDKHIEVIVRQMRRRVRVKDVGNTNFLVDEQVEKHLFEKENERVLERAFTRPRSSETQRMSQSL
jgi:hypothetical protein